MLDQWDVWLPRLKSVVGAFENNVSIRNSCEIEAVSEVTWLPSIQRRRKLICMGTNYTADAAEVSSDPLRAPYSFIKITSNTLRGSNAMITLLDIAQMNDWEVELTVVIGRAARHVEEGRAMDYAAGYTIINDVSARDWVASSPKFLGIDWVVGKSIDGSVPIASMCAESFVTQKLPVPTELENRLPPAAAFVLCTQKSKLGCIQP
jgi:2-keto-4-pentenoate hydratase/2-oxohepta-3-ene-1,7-dioic acid hydratase in catechol pathway